MDTIQEILKNSNHHLSLFRDEEKQPYKKKSLAKKQQAKIFFLRIILVKYKKQL